MGTMLWVIPIFMIFLFTQGLHLLQENSIINSYKKRYTHILYWFIQGVLSWTGITHIILWIIIDIYKVFNVIFEQDANNWGELFITIEVTVFLRSLKELNKKWKTWSILDFFQFLNWKLFYDWTIFLANSFEKKLFRNTIEKFRTVSLIQSSHEQFDDLRAPIKELLWDKYEHSFEIFEIL